MRAPLTTIPALGLLLAMAQAAPTTTPLKASSFGRIIGGSKVNGRPYPFAVALSVVSKGTLGLCGGSLISDRYVLTAAHCLTDRQSGTPISASAVTAGVGSNSVKQASVYLIRKVSVHPDYDYTKLRNDIALLRLEKAVKLNGGTRVVALANSQIKDGDVLLAVGWGKTSNTGRVTDDLRQVEITVGPTGDCHAADSDFTSQNGPQLCAAHNEGHDTCQGDSGGPLLYNNGRTYQLAGLTSYGRNPGSTTADCGTNTVAAFYTRPAYYVDWIARTTGITKQRLLGQA
ncbi:hypothetical protein IWQ60_002216 [Tieghemiomyces parasiticus]|uniref:Peptidase S1 domain-containing protein n=1 Tax=Tieghemiomyces parasiticus TaxID=78921 RepID=A0A9W8DVV9_9FUNG|nr:hypothetical protein IWQ60_002216 [Tieghemiomyces parasiticus]